MIFLEYTRDELIDKIIDDACKKPIETILSDYREHLGETYSKLNDEDLLICSDSMGITSGNDSIKV